MPITPPPPPLTRISLLKGFLGIFLPLWLLLGVVASMHYYAIYTTERSTLEASESLNVDLARRMIISDISGVISDLMFLAEHIERQGVLDDLTYNDEKRISEEFRIFAKQKGLYDQIRYLNREGMEIVRVNFNGGDPNIVIQRELQNKRNRYYFRQALAQDRGGLYLSPLDLNIEAGKIEYPLKPMMRFGTPVFDQGDGKKGIILLNYFGNRLIENFTRAAANIANHVELINSDGYWLSNPNSEKEWGFMLGKETLFQGQFPGAWKQITLNRSGQFQTDAGLFTFSTIDPLAIALDTVNPNLKHQADGRGDGKYWKIVSHVSSAELSATLPFFIRQHFALYMAMFGLVMFGSWFLAYSRQQHRRAEAQRNYEQRFRHTLENIELAAVALNRAGEVTFCNDYFLNMTGWRRDQVIGETWLGKFVPDERHGEVERIIQLMNDADQFPPHIEIQVKTRDQGIKLIDWNNTLSYDAGGEVIGVTGIGQDITEQRRTEEELRKLSQAMEQSPSIVLITDKQGLIEYANPKFTEVTGYALNEVQGKNPRFLKSGETTSDEYSNLWQTVFAGGEWRGEFHNRKKNGELYWESASISAIRNPQGEITHFLAVKEDITERKRLEQEVEERNRELVRSQALTTIGRMASMIAHDLRNPLSSVKMTLQILGKKPGAEENEEIRELRHISLEQIRYMEEILSDMLTYSRPDALKPDWITIDKVIDMAISISQRRLDECGVKLAAHYHPGLPTLYGDATKLRQVFSNLISNAAQAVEAAESPRISIDVMLELGVSGTGVRIEICDNGCGIPPEETGKVFEPFFTTRTKGTGLGLAIVKRILDQHHASIEILNTPPRGTCIAVVLPVTPRATRNATGET